MKMFRLITPWLFWVTFVYSYENIALRKPATQSSSEADLVFPNPPADRANDGDRNNVAAMDQNSCIHTAKGRQQAWWRVDLGGTHWINYVYITYRDWTVGSFTSAGRFGGFSIYVSDTSNWWDGQRCYINTVEPAVSRTPYPCNAVGRYVTVYNDRNSTSASDYPSYYYLPTTEKAVLELCEVEINGCPLGKYGPNCLQTCSPNCDFQDICFYNNGTCFHGCEAGYYNSNCSLSCPDNCQGNVCQKDSGNCNSCIPGLTGDKCDSPICGPGSYGDGCTQSCPNCGGNGRCDYNSGNCNSGCKDGFYGTQCQTPCSENCGGNGACNRTKGYCLQSCKPGWIGLKCEDKGCPDPGYYGERCEQTCPNCGGNGRCIFESGKCTSGCKTGWKGDKCDTVGCIGKKYGSLCDKDCPGSCGGDGTCDFKVGNCLDGCIDGWREDKCDKVCQENTFGKDCKEICGQCSNGTCHHINGSCLNGCASGWIGPSCTTASEQINEGNNNVPIIGGAAAGGILLVLIIVLVFVLYRRKARSSAGTSYKKGETSASHAEGNKLYQNVNEVSETKKNQPPERPKTAPKRPLPSSEQQDKQVDDDGGYYNASQVPQKGIKVDDLKEYIGRMKVGEALKKEFAAIPYGAIHPHTIGESAVNKPKNRFKTTFPYDHSRVILQHGTGKTDYINANYIDSTSEPKTYIATQGPIKPTIVDFWQMVWEQNIGKIVMLTNLKETVKVKCEKYWPDANQPVTYGTYVLTLEDERKFCYYVLREFNLQDKKTRQTRHVLQYHFTTWPDHGTPDPILLVIFQKRVSASHTLCTGPTLVHCSAGIGRTGTYIGLDALLEQGRKTKFVDICDYVATMRKNRMNMIQNADQYVVLHDALLEAFQMENTAIKMDSFRAEWEKMKNFNGPKNQQRLKIEYEKFTSLRPVYDQTDYASAKEDQNRSKNRNEVLALDKYRPYISSFPVDGTNYINAVILPSLVSLKAFIVTQHPLMSTVADFWRLINDHESYTIVLFEGQKDDKVKFFPQGKEEFTCDACSIDTICANDMNEGVTEFKHKVHYKETDEEKEIKVYRVQLGTASLPNSIQILKVIELVENWQRENGSGPCTVISLDGTTPCDVFCTVTSNMQRLRIDNEVDIFQTAYLFQQRRPEFFKQINAYDLCFEAINVHLSSESVYFNS